MNLQAEHCISTFYMTACAMASIFFPVTLVWGLQYLHWDALFLAEWEYKYNASRPHSVGTTILFIRHDYSEMRSTM
jgi:hypothetical protein